MAYTTIDDPSLYFQIALYTGNGNAGKEITLGSANFSGEYVGQAIQPDWLWGKCTNLSQNHNLFDTSRGLDKRLTSDQSDAENTDSTTITAVASNSFTLGNSTNLNNADDDFVAWLWKANGGTTTTNDASSTGVGTIDSVFQAETTAGFSIVTHTGSNSAGTIAHGLGVAPKWVLTKNRTDNGEDWANYHVGLPSAEYYIRLNTTGAQATGSSVWGDTAPSSTVITFGGANGKTNAGSSNYVHYCFAPIQGYSKFGKYTGNGNADGPFVYTGFKPSWLMTKRTDSSDHWRIVDNKREPFNDGSMQGLKANANDTHSDSGSRGLDFLSNGFKVRTTDPDSNASGGTYIYMSFAEHPFVSSEGVPVTAR